MHAATRFRDGFRAIFRAPALILAEIAWRWSFGAAAGLLVALSLAEYLDSLPVSEADRLFLRSANPLLVAQAVGDILHGSGPRLVRAIAILVPALAVLWSFAAALGRSATLRVLLRRERLHFRSLLGLSFLRTALVLATILAVLGAAILSPVLVSPADNTVASTTTRANPQAGLSVALLMLLTLVTLYVFGAINWLLSVAPIFAVRDGRDTLSSISEAVAGFRAHKGEFIAVSSLFALLHLVAVMAAGFGELLAAGLLARAGVVAAMLGAMIVSLIYLAAVDFLCITRLAAYIAIVDQDQLLAVEAAPRPDFEAPMAPVSTGAD